MTLVAIPRGEVITVENIAGTRRAQLMVLSACDRSGVGYFCASCGTHLADIGDVVLHRDARAPDLTHGIVRWCGECRKYEACDQKQLDALTPERFL